MMDAKTVVIRNLKNLAWYCHKNAYEQHSITSSYYKYMGALRALRDTGMIDNAYFKQMHTNARRLLQKARLWQIKKSQ